MRANKAFIVDHERSERSERSERKGVLLRKKSEKSLKIGVTTRFDRYWPLFANRALGRKANGRISSRPHFP